MEGRLNCSYQITGTKPCPQYFGTYTAETFARTSRDVHWDGHCNLAFGSHGQSTGRDMLEAELKMWEIVRDGAKENRSTDW